MEADMEEKWVDNVRVSIHLDSENSIQIYSSLSLSLALAPLVLAQSLPLARLYGQSFWCILN